MGNHAGEDLQQGKFANVINGAVRVAKTTASMCCCWRTVWTWTV